jgi:hypothetical protein
VVSKAITIQHNHLTSLVRNRDYLHREAKKKETPDPKRRVGWRFKKAIIIKQCRKKLLPGFGKLNIPNMPHTLYGYSKSGRWFGHRLAT